MSSTNGKPSPRLPLTTAELRIIARLASDPRSDDLLSTLLNVDEQRTTELQHEHWWEQGIDCLWCELPQAADRDASTTLSLLLTAPPSTLAP